jgi:MOSC domain-containing protein YiiM
MKAELDLDSASVGDPERFRTLVELESGLGELPTPNADRGTVVLIVRRGVGGRRETPERLVLTPEEGVPGDAWNRKEGATVEGQITVMQVAVAEMIANGQPLTLFGDNLFLDIDVVGANLPPGTRVRIGDAVLEVTPKIHKGCRKFSGRFGVDALRFVSTPEGRARNLRGLYVRVLTAGEAGPGDVVEVIERGPPLPTEATV